MPYVGRTPSAVPVTADDIPANSIDASKIIDGSIELAEIADNSITDAKLNSSKLDGIETGATADQTKADIEGLGIAASSITGALPAISGASLTGIETVTKATTAPSSPAQGDMWFDTTSGTNAMKVWSGSGWDKMSNKFSATGGTESTYSSGGVNYKVHTFTSSGTFTAESSGTVDVLVVAGGGAGGSTNDGGGGAGGVVVASGLSVTAQNYTMTVGAGGGAQEGHPQYSDPENGEDSSAFSLVATGGGGGSRHSTTAPSSGGSGGGGGHNTSGVLEIGASSTQASYTGATSYGNSGGNGGFSSPYLSGGGGGAGSAGGNAVSGTSAGSGGSGISNIYRTGSAITYAGGGGGGTQDGGTAGAGGSGGGGAGTTITVRAGDGAVNTGSGGGGGGYDGSTTALIGGAGGSGIVVVRYAV